MFETIKRSFRLVKLCLHVLAVDKELIFFPVFSSIGVVLVMLTFLGVGIGIGALDRLNAGTVGGGDLVVAFGFYVLSYFVIIFFNSALVYAAHERLAGGDPNIRSGLNGAMRSVVTIFMWSVIAATVGLILQILSSLARQRGGVVGMIAYFIVAMLGAAWSLITYFIVPLIVIEHRSLGESFKTSLSMLRRTWGEQIVANFGLGIAAFLFYLAAALIIGALFFVLSPLGSFGVFTAIAVGVVLIVGISLVFATLNGIYKAALYNYAVDGMVPSLFPDDVIRGAFRPE